MKTILSMFLFIFVGAIGLSAQSLDSYKAHNEGWMVSIEKAQDVSQANPSWPILPAATGVVGASD